MHTKIHREGFCTLIALFALITTSPAYAQKAGTPFGSAAENPGISAAVEVLGRYVPEDSQESGGGLSDVELGFQAPIDPFARADILLHYSAGLLEPPEHEEHEDAHEHGSGFAVEEALLTLTSLPFSSQLSLGRMRSRMGLANPIHLHDFNFVEYPRSITTYWGEEGLSVDGLRLSWLSPLPFWAEMVVEGQKAPDEEGRDLATAGVDLFFPFGDDLGLALTGFGYFDKPPHHHHEEEEMEEEDHEDEAEEEEPEFGLNGWGLGFRSKWKPTAKAMYRHFILQGELMSRKLEEEYRIGFYTMAEYLLARRWTIGAMFQRFERPHDEHDGGDEEGSSSSLELTLTFWPTEFQRLRLQYDHPFETETGEKQLLLKWTYIIGPHKPHAY